MDKQKCSNILNSILEEIDLYSYINNPNEIIEMDSLTMVELIVIIESKFGCEFSLDELDFDNFRTYNTILLMVFNKVSSNE